MVCVLTGIERLVVGASRAALLLGKIQWSSVTGCCSKYPGNDRPTLSQPSKNFLSISNSNPILLPLGLSNIRHGTLWVNEPAPSRQIGRISL